MANQWLRLWHDMPNDPKWRTIARVSGQPISAVIAVYLHVLVSASANADERGKTQSLCIEDVASALDMDDAGVSAILDAMQGRVMDGDSLTGWDKRQPAREDGSAERAKAWRERKKNDGERDRTQANAEERPDKDKDTEEEHKPSPAPSASSERKRSPKAEGSDVFEEAWRQYPKRFGGNSKSDALKAWDARVRQGATEEQLLAGVKRYAAHLRETRREGTQYVKTASVFFGPGLHYQEAYGSPAIGQSEDWWTPAGFANMWEAENAGCTQRTAYRWSERKMVEVTA